MEHPQLRAIRAAGQVVIACDVGAIPPAAFDALRPGEQLLRPVDVQRLASSQQGRTGAAVPAGAAAGAVIDAALMRQARSGR